MKAEQEAKGDLGLVAEGSRAKQRTLFGGSMGSKPPAGKGVWEGPWGLCHWGRTTTDLTTAQLIPSAPLPAGLSVAGVFAAFKGIALEGGKGGVDKKAAAVKKLLVACSGAEAKFVIRGLQVLQLEGGGAKYGGSCAAESQDALTHARRRGSCA